MATKGYVVMRYSPPQGTAGVYEAWLEAVNTLISQEEPAWRAAGVTSWQTTHDVFGNSPRAQHTFELDTVEQALAWYGGLRFRETIDAFLKLGTLDYEVSVHKLSREG